MSSIGEPASDEVQPSFTQDTTFLPVRRWKSVSLLIVYFVLFGVLLRDFDDLVEVAFVITFLAITSLGILESLRIRYVVTQDSLVVMRLAPTIRVPWTDVTIAGDPRPVPMLRLEMGRQTPVPWAAGRAQQVEIGYVRDDKPRTLLIAPEHRDEFLRLIRVRTPQLLSL